MSNLSPIFIVWNSTFFSGFFDNFSLHYSPSKSFLAIIVLIISLWLYEMCNFNINFVLGNYWIIYKRDLHWIKHPRELLIMMIFSSNYWYRIIIIIVIHPLSIRSNKWTTIESDYYSMDELLISMNQKQYPEFTFVRAFSSFIRIAS